MSQKLHSLFNPKSIAIVGVSADHSRLSSVIYTNILDANFKGKVYPVNPNYKEVFGTKCYKKVSQIEDEVELVVIVTPSATVLDIVKDCAKAKAKFLIIISAGFKDAGADGAKLEQKVLEVAGKSGMRIVGPNCLGVICSQSNLNASFAVQFPKAGSISFFSQSGAFNTALLDLSETTKLGFKHFISIGNKSDLNELDFLEDWFNDEDVKVIGMYLEDFVDGKDFIDLIEKYKHKKPVILLNSGESEEGQKAISSHTGSIASPKVVVNTALKQANVVKTSSIEKLFGNLMAFERSKLPKGKNVAIVTNAGGPAIMLTDMLIQSGLKIAEISESVKIALKKSLPANASVKNPIDILGDAPSDRYKIALDILENDPNVDSILAVLTPQYITEIEDTAKVLIDKVKFSNKTIIPLFIGGKYVNDGLERMYDYNIAAFQYAELAVDALKNLSIYSTNLSEKTKSSLHLRLPKYKKEFQELLQSKEKMTLSEHQKKLLALEAGLNIPPEKVVKSFGEAVDFVNTIGYPVVLKATTKDLIHKTDFKGIAMNILNEETLKKSFFDIRRNLQTKTETIEPEILVQKQVDKGLELFIGAKRDGGSNIYSKEGKGFGHLLVFGHGGIYTETYKDFSEALIPRSKDQLKTLVENTKVSEIINGARTGKKLDIEKLIETLDAIQKLCISYPEIESIDLNPVILTEKDCHLVDIKIFLSR